MFEYTAPSPPLPGMVEIRRTATHITWEDEEGDVTMPLPGTPARNRMIDDLLAWSAALTAQERQRAQAADQRTESESVMESTPTTPRGPRPCPPEHIPAGSQDVGLIGDWLVYTNEFGNLVSFPAPDTEGEAKLVGSIIDLAQLHKREKGAASQSVAEEETAESDASPPPQPDSP